MSEIVTQKKIIMLLRVSFYFAKVVLLLGPNIFTFKNNLFKFFIYIVNVKLSDNIQKHQNKYNLFHKVIFLHTHNLFLNKKRSKTVNIVCHKSLLEYTNQVPPSTTYLQTYILTLILMNE